MGACLPQEMILTTCAYTISVLGNDRKCHELLYDSWNNFSSTWVKFDTSWWRHQIKTFSALLAIRAGNSPVPGEFPAQRPVRRSFDVFLNKRLSNQCWGWCFETPSHPLWRHCNVMSFAEVCWVTALTYTSVIIPATPFTNMVLF